MLQSLWPEWFEQTIAAVEREAVAMGLGSCRWGERPPNVPLHNGRPVGPMCSDCQLRIE